MVVLRNLKRKDNIVEYDYFTEDAGDRGHVVYDIDKKEVISKKLAKRDTVYDGYTRYFFYSVLCLERAIETKDYVNGGFKEEYIAMWS